MYGLFIDLRPDFFLSLWEVVYRQIWGEHECDEFNTIMLSNEVLLLSKVNCSSKRSLLGFQRPTVTKSSCNTRQSLFDPVWIWNGQKKQLRGDFNLHHEKIKQVTWICSFDKSIPTSYSIQKEIFADLSFKALLRNAPPLKERVYFNDITLMHTFQLVLDHLSAGVKTNFTFFEL